ncbi:hypothetical protein RJ639_017159 [Escallonia herrerae]|uniref:RING-type domain-containing protein n=1 Tax=Escallonia herrerae TaxID=1293975 RepID=A0AA88VCI3_9ASTE|nr:hypothetical protein RJ639_017159 [Escallonia herrerae]
MVLSGKKGKTHAGFGNTDEINAWVAPGQSLGPRVSQKCHNGTRDIETQNLGCEVNFFVGLSQSTMTTVMEIFICVMLLFVGIAVLTMIHVCMAGRASRNTTVDIQTVDIRRSSRSASMCSDELKKLPCFDYKVEEKGPGSSNWESCAVCLESFKVGEKCRLLPICEHSFHVHCIDSWLLKTGACAICRTGALQSGISSEVGVELT